MFRKKKNNKEKKMFTITNGYRFKEENDRKIGLKECRCRQLFDGNIVQKEQSTQYNTSNGTNINIVSPIFTYLFEQIHMHGHNRTNSMCFFCLF